jgi:surfeit locus 1 family protein
MEFRRLALTGSFDHDKEVFMTGRTYEGNAGFHIVTPFTLTDGRIILVNRGWVSESYRAPEKRKFSLIEGETGIEAIIRFPGKKGYFVPENEPENGFWFTLVPAQIVEHLGLDGQAETAVYAAALRTSDEIRLPIGARTETNLRNSHLGYAYHLVRDCLRADWGVSGVSSSGGPAYIRGCWPWQGQLIARIRNGYEVLQHTRQ